MWSIYAQAILAVIVAAGLVLLSVSKRDGMRRVGVIALWTGAVNAAMAWLSSYGIHAVSRKIAQSQGASQPLQQKAFTIAQGVVDDIKLWWLWYSLAVFAIGAILLVVYRLTKQTSQEQAAFLAHDAGVDVAKLGEIPKPPARPFAPKQPKSSKKIQ